MKSLADREKGFEAEFKRNQELMFRVTARRNRLFGLWAAAQLGLPLGEEAEAYAKPSSRPILRHRAMAISSRKCGPTSSRKVSLRPRQRCAQNSSAPLPKPVAS